MGNHSFGAGFQLSLLRQVCRFDIYVDVVSAILSLGECCAFGVLALEQALLIVTDFQFEASPSFEQRQADGPIPLPEREGPTVEVNRGGTKYPHPLTFFFGSFAMCCYPCDRPDGQISRQAKAVAHLMVGQYLNSDRVCDFLWQRSVYEVTGVCKCQECCINVLRQFGQGFKLTSYCLHWLGLFTFFTIWKNKF